MHQLSIDTEVLSELTVLELRLLLVQVRQLLVALYWPGLCKVLCKVHTMLLTSSDISPAHELGSHSPQAPIQPSESVSVAHQGRWCFTLVQA